MTNTAHEHRRATPPSDPSNGQLDRDGPVADVWDAASLRMSAENCRIRAESLNRLTGAGEDYIWRPADGARGTLLNVAAILDSIAVTRATPPADADELLATVHNTLGLLTSCIKSGAAWSAPCQRALDDANAALTVLAGPPPADNPGGDRMGVKSVEEVWAEVEAKARLWAGYYQPATDGRNTFIMFADWARGAAMLARAALSPPQAGERREQIAREELDRLEAWAKRALLFIDGEDLAGSELSTPDGDAATLSDEGYALFGLEPGNRAGLIAAARLALPPQAAPGVVEALREAQSHIAALLGGKSPYSATNPNFSRVKAAAREFLERTKALAAFSAERS